MFKISVINFFKSKIFQAKKLDNLSFVQPTKSNKMPKTDTFSSRILSEKNDLRITKDWLGGYSFKEGQKNIGYSDFKIVKNGAAPKENFPADWFIKNGKSDAKGNFPLKPYMYVCELFINDRMGKTILEKRRKKYGTMAMQHLLKIAYEQHCSHRITLLAERIGHTEFYPGKFYQKMGFSFSPEILERLTTQDGTLKALPETGKMFLTNPKCIINYPL